MKNGRFAFWSSVAIYDVPLRLIAKPLVYFLFVLTVFLLGVTAEALRVNIDCKSVFSLQWGQFDPKFQVEGVAPPTILLVTKLG